MRLIVLIAVAVGALLAAVEAGASRIQVKASHQSAFEYVGHDWLGKVRVEFQDTSEDRGDVFSLYGLSFANLCSRRGSALNQTIPIHADKLFSYRRHGVTVTGNVIGKRSAPREIAGLATFSRPGCTSGPWWFEVKP
jgi:hypothetical protein